MKVPTAPLEVTKGKPRSDTQGKSANSKDDMADLALSPTALTSSLPGVTHFSSPASELSRCTDQDWEQTKGRGNVEATAQQGLNTRE